MFGSSILEVAIGLVFVYLLLSLMVTASSEIIAAWLKRRHKNLMAGLVNLLGDAETRKLYQHPLIKGLFPQTGLPDGCLRRIWRAVRQSPTGPSYIPSRTFAVALLDIMGLNQITELTNKVRGALARFPDAIPDARAVKAMVQAAVKGFTLAPDVVRDFEGLIITIPDTDSADTAMNKIDQVLQANSKYAPIKQAIAPVLAAVGGGAKSTKDIKDEIQLLLPASELAAELTKLLDNVPDTASPALLKREVLAFLERAAASAFVRKIPAGDLRRSMELLLEEAGHDLEKFKTNIETWFNNSMERVSGWYKRKTQWVNLWLAVVITLFLNVDSVLIVKTLSGNSTLRESLVAQATKFAEKPPVQLTVMPQSTVDSGAAKKQPARSEFPALTFSDDPAIAGHDLEGRIAVSNAVDADVVLTLTTSKTNLVTIPATVTIPKGKSSASFAILTRADPAGTKATLTASNKNLATTAVLALEGNPEQKFELLHAQLEGLGLPIGWTSLPSSQEKKAREFFLLVPWSKEASFWKTIGFHWLGWLLTAIAVSMGAPFWFDLLNKFITVRSSGKAPEEKQKPPKEVPKPAEPGTQPAK